MFEKRQREEGDINKRQSDVDEAVLLKDWDFARFFPSKKIEVQETKCEPAKEVEQKRTQLQRQTHLDMDDAWAKYKAIATPPARHKQLFQKPSEKVNQDTLNDMMKYKKDLETETPNRFFRGFRRENSDLFPLPSTRHSAIYFPKHDSQIGVQKQLRSSGIFNNPRKQVLKPVSGEPILTDFIKMNDSLKMSNQGEIRKVDKLNQERKVMALNPTDALKNVAALIRQNSDSNSPSRQSSVNSDSPSTSICFTSSTSFEKAGTPDLTANTFDNNMLSDNNTDASNNIMKPRREKTESDIVFRRSSQYIRHAELLASGQEVVLALDQVNCSLLRTLLILLQLYFGMRVLIMVL